MPEICQNRCQKVIKGQLVPASELEKRVNKIDRCDRFQKWLQANLNAKEFLSKCCLSIPVFIGKPQVKQNIEASKVKINQPRAETKPNGKKSWLDEDHLNCPVCSCCAIDLDVNNTLKSNRNSCTQIRQLPYFNSELPIKSQSLPVLVSSSTGHSMWLSERNSKVTFAMVFADVRIFSDQDDSDEKLDEEFDYFSEYSLNETHSSFSSEYDLTTADRVTSL